MKYIAYTLILGLLLLAVRIYGMLPKSIQERIKADFNEVPYWE